ncbi:MAG TPA: hypothetical protein VF746_10100 [Longimicrobium sp.]|jgi:hypothetical protein
MSPLLVLGVVYTLAALVLTAAAAYLLYRLCRASVRFVCGPDAPLAGGPKVRLLGLVAAAVVFLPTVAEAVPALLRFVGALFRAIPRTLLDSHREVAAECARECALRGTAALVEAPVRAVADAFARSGLASLDVGRIVLFFAAWGAASYLCRLALSVPGRGAAPTHAVVLAGAAQRQGTRSLRGIGRLLGRAFPHLQLYGPFAAVLAVGTYLSIASMVALPDLMAEVRTVDEVSPRRLQERLVGASREFTSAVPERDPLATVRQALAQRREGTSTLLPAADGGANGAAPAARVLTASLDTEPSPERPAWIDQLARDVAEYDRAREDLLKRQASLGDELRVWQQSYVHTAVTQYEVENLDRKGARQKGQQFVDIVSDFATQATRAEAALHNGQLLVNDFDNALYDWARAVGPWLVTADAEVSGEDYYLARMRIDSVLSEARRSTGNAALSLKIKSRKAMDEDLEGPVRWAAGWLIRTESLPLVLIVGMLGFGLLGSVSSSIVRDKRQRRRGEPPVPDLTRVVVRGASAAVVVFLMVMGGLTVFAAGSATPNPYMLLLTCLVAAVFGEDVWKATHEWFKERLETAMATTMQAGGPGGAAAAAGTVVSATVERTQAVEVVQATVETVSPPPGPPALPPAAPQK